MATERQKLAFNIRTKKIIEKKPVVMGDVMKEAGYSDRMSEHPGVLVASDGWAKLLAKYADEPIMDAIYKDALDKKDKRNATENRKIFLKVKGRFVDKIAVSKIDESLSRYTYDKRESDTEDNTVESPQEPEENTGE